MALTSRNLPKVGKNIFCSELQATREVKSMSPDGQVKELALESEELMHTKSVGMPKTKME